MIYLKCHILCLLVLSSEYFKGVERPDRLGTCQLLFLEGHLPI